MYGQQFFFAILSGADQNQDAGALIIKTNVEVWS
jgi:hypothetical protein